MVANRLNQLKEEKCLTNKQIAEAVGTHLNTIQTTASGRRPLPLSLAQKIGLAFDVSANWLMGIEKDAKPEPRVPVKKYHHINTLARKREKIKVDTSFLYQPGHSLWKGEKQKI